MSSKVDQLENQQDQVTEMSNFEKSTGNYKTKDQIKAVEFRTNFATNGVMNESNKTRHEIKIQIDVFQRTAVFSSDFAMWI
ncbi:MAG TPA: hypothetical protein VH797_03330 [Nitrososphaeraceae archaeon]|jgi:hypothetical protein